jgi:hypothetical protein
MENITIFVHIIMDLPVILEEMTIKRGNTVHLWTTNESQIQLGDMLISVTTTNWKTDELLSQQSLMDIIII